MRHRVRTVQLFRLSPSHGTVSYDWHRARVCNGAFSLPDPNVYYYLCVVREACFRDPGDRPLIRLDWPTRALCVLLIGGILALGIAPARILDTLSTSVAAVTGAPPQAASAVVNVSR